MTYTYTWANQSKVSLKREDAKKNVSWIPVCPGNCDYDEFIASGATAADYVEPPAPDPLPEPTTAEKLAATGLSVDELKALLAS